MPSTAPSKMADSLAERMLYSSERSAKKELIRVEKYDVFISYRRDGGEMLAHILYERLRDAGYAAFQDVESLRSGNFNTALYDVIENCRDFVLILSPGALDRCANPDDWVKNEIVYALEHNKNIIPIMMRGFQWPEVLPPEIDALRYKNGLTANTEYFDQFLIKLEDFLDSKKNTAPKPRAKHSLRVILFASLYALGLLSPLLILFVFHQPFVLWQRLLYACWLIGGAIWFCNEIETRPEVAASCFGTITEEDLQQHPDVIFRQVTGVFGKDIFISNQKPEGFTSYYVLERLEFGSWDGKKTNYLKVQFRRMLKWYDPSVLYLHSLSRGGQAVKMLSRQGFLLQLNPDDLSKDVDHLSKGTLHVFLSYRKKQLVQAEIYNCSDEELRARIRKEC